MSPVSSSSPAANAIPIHSRHFSFNFKAQHILSLFSLRQPKPRSLSVIKLRVFKPQSSLQTHNPSQQHSHTSTKKSSSFTPIPPPPSHNQGGDPELREVLELATNSELFELEGILFGPSYFSPLLKSMTRGVELDRFMIEDDFEEREQFIDVLESRFLYLAADARSTLRGWRPSYGNVLLDVRRELSIPCSRKLTTEDLEMEIYIHLTSECSRDWDTGAAIRVGAAELCSVLLKGGQMISLLKISELVSSQLSGKTLLEAAKHKIESEVTKKALVRVASRYLGFRSLASFVGPILWGKFLMDIVIQMLGIDYFRILQAIYAFAQIRILRRHGLYLDKLRTGF